MTKNNIDYSKTIIYKLVCNDLNVKDIYIGHTTDFTKRKWCHKSRCSNINSKYYYYKVYEYIRKNGDWKNWSMIEIEKIPCVDGNEARSKERYWIETLKANLNTISAFETKEELKTKYSGYGKIWNEQNKERKKETDRLYRLNNKEKIKEQVKQYNIANKEKINENKRMYGSQTYICECGCVMRLDSKSKHNKTKKHKSFYDKIL